MRLAAAIAALALGSGCILYIDPNADLTVTWTFEGWDCARADVDTVEVALHDEGGSLVAADEVACTWGGATYRGIAPGLYAVRVTGKDQGFAKYRAEALIDVHGGDNAVHVDLSY